METDAVGDGESDTNGYETDIMTNGDSPTSSRCGREHPARREA